MGAYKILTRNDIVNKVKSLKVGPEQEAPFRLFFMIALHNPSKQNIFKKHQKTLYSMCATCIVHDDGTRDYNYDELINRIEIFANEHGGIIDLW